MLDGVLQAGSCHSKIDGILVVITLAQGIDQAAAEAVAAANAVDDVQRM